MNRIVCRIALSFWLGAVLPLIAYAAEFVLPLPQLTGAFPYGQTAGPIDICISSGLSALSNMTISISGIHHTGWWDGDNVEDFYHGPIGATLTFYINSTASYPDRWRARLPLSSYGNFSNTVTLGRCGGGSLWDFLKDGVTDLQAINELVYGFGGHVTTAPYVYIADISLTINGKPLPKFTSIDSDGTFTWSTIPSGGHIELFNAPALEGPWQRVAAMTNQESSFTPTISNSSPPQFYRATWIENIQP